MTNTMLIKPTNEDMKVVLNVKKAVWKKYLRWVEILNILHIMMVVKRIPFTDPEYDKLEKEKKRCVNTLINAGFSNKHYFRTSWVIVEPGSKEETAWLAEEAKIENQL